MSNDTGRRRPNGLQYVAYCYGRVLPASMRDWCARTWGQGRNSPDDDPLAIPCVWCWPRFG